MPCFGGVCYRSAPAARPAPAPARAKGSSRARPSRAAQAAGPFGSRSYGLGGGKVAQVPIYQESQRAAQKSLLQNALQLLPQLIGGQLPTAGFQPYAQQQREEFEQDTIPSLMERLNAMGASGAGARANVLANARTDLEKALMGQQLQYGLGQQQFLGSILPALLSSGLAPQYESSYRIPAPPPQYMPPPQQPSFGQSFLGALPGIIGGIGSLFGGPMGAAGGALGAGVTRLR
jgi:hypothetical protein